MDSRWNSDDFPYLNSAHYSINSPPTRVYNCVAWAAGFDDCWLWPTSFFWPLKTHKDESVESLLGFFESLDFQECDDCDLEENYEKIALYAQLSDDGRLIPTHAARQLENGHWTSKMGANADIVHREVNDVSGPAYGTPIRFMKRKNR